MPQAHDQVVVGQEPCPICGMPRRLSDEDVIPVWARSHVILLSSFGPKDQRPRRVRMRICTVCNATLGRAFENPSAELMKPMLHGSAVTLDRKDQRRVSCWIIKTSLLMTALGLAEGDPDRARALALTRRLMVERLPPVQTLIRIFTRDIEDRSSARVSGDLKPKQAPPTAFFSITSIGFLGWEMAIGPDLPVLEYQSAVSRDPGYLQIWPPMALDVRWPPQTTVSNEEIDTLREAYVASSRPGLSEPIVRQWDGPES